MPSIEIIMKKVNTLSTRMDREEYDEESKLNKFYKKDNIRQELVGSWDSIIDILNNTPEHFYDYGDYDKKIFMLLTKETYNKYITEITESFKNYYDGLGWKGDDLTSINSDPLFIQKIVVPDKAKIAVIGDIHSSIHSLVRNLKKLKVKGFFDDNYILTKDHYVIFLGDLVDRGPYSLETLLLAIKLKVNNINNVFVLNGNHEDIDIYNSYGLKEESDNQLGTDAETHKRLEKLLWYLPSALFVKFNSDKKWIQYCHGAIHSSYESTGAKTNLSTVTLIDAKSFLNSKAECYLLPVDIEKAKFSGFKWSDFALQKEPIKESRRGKGIFKYNYDTVKNYNDANNLFGIISGHQDLFPFLTMLSDSTGADKVLTNSSKIVNVNGTNYVPTTDAKTINKNRYGISYDEVGCLLYAIHPKGAKDIIAKLDVGKDFIACCTSTGVISRFAKGGAYDTLLIVTKNTTKEEEEENVLQTGGYYMRYLKYKTKYLGLKKNI
jgi:hypothetical protein